MNATVRDIMTTHVVAVRKNASFKDMAARLREHRVSALPVLDDSDRVIGVVSEADLLTKEALEFGGAKVSGILRHREQAKAVDALLTDPARFTITVNDGVVTVAGTPETAVVGHDMIEEIRHVEGVVAVRDRLSYPQAQRPVPVSGPLF